MADEDVPDKAGGGDDDRLDKHPRFIEVVAQRREARAKVAALEARIAELEPKLADRETLAQQLAQAKAAHESDRASWATTRSALELGYTDPESLDLASYLHGKMPEADRPSLPDLLKAWKTEPDKAPKAMQPYLAAFRPAEPPKADAKADPPPAAKAPSLNGGAAPMPTSGGTAGQGGYTAAMIDAAVAAAQRSGDWSRVQEMLPKVQEQVRERVGR